ncbi:MAG: PilW family protein [Sedimenticolaceae bacterium]
MKPMFHRQAGLTLVELLVATTLSLVLLSGVLLVFSANKTTYKMQTGLGTLQENGRYAMRQITSDLQLAGFGGCLSPHIGPRVVTLATGPSGYLDYLKKFSEGEFFDGRNDETGTHTYGGRAMLTGTDSIEIRGPLRSAVSYVTKETFPGDPIEVVGTDRGFAVDEYLVIADCAGADIFRATAVDDSSGNTEIGHGSSGNTQDALSRKYGADAVVMEFATHTYFVGNTGRVNSSGNAIGALYRFDGNNSEELVDGVENLQVEYALDTDGNGVIDAFRDPGGVTDWDEVMAVRLSLLMDSVDAASAVEAPYKFLSSTVAIDPPDGDLRLRQEFSALVSVRNSVL